MTSELLIAVGGTLIPLAMLAIAWGQWTGRIRPTSDDPDAFGDRIYLFAPVAVAALAALVGLALSEVTGRPGPGGIGVLVALPLMLVGIVIMLWRPHRLRPRWDDRPPRRRRG